MAYDSTLHVVFVLLYIVLIVDCNFLKSGCCLCVVSLQEGWVEYSLMRIETARKGRGHVAGDDWQESGVLLSSGSEQVYCFYQIICVFSIHDKSRLQIFLAYAK